jgi:hypothetical protein
MADNEDTDIRWYEALQESDSEVDIKIYSFGSIPEAMASGIRWVIMEKVVPIRSIYEGEPLAEDITEIKRKLFRFTKPDYQEGYRDHPRFSELMEKWEEARTPEEQARVLLEPETSFDGKPIAGRQLQGEELEKFILSLIKFTHKYGLKRTGDIHGGNFGRDAFGRYKIFDISGEGE